MDWLKKKKNRLVQVRERGAMLLEDIIECCDGKSNPIKFFSADQIIKATNNFSESNVISEVEYFTYRLYSGKIDNHPMIFFRKNSHGYQRRGYCRNIAISSMVSGHKNFLKLLGCCLELEKPVIVYNFTKMSSLDIETVVSWKRRIKIAEEIATALAFLHTAFPRPFVYRIMSLGKIFLDEDGVARLWDFSCCISIPQGETFVQVDRIVGTLGFAEDNYLSTGTVSEKTDVFAIGNLMQKLLTGEEIFREFRKKYQDDSGADGDGYETFGRWLIKQRTYEILEKRDEVGEAELCQMEAFLMLSLRCTGRTNREIPNMVEVAKELKNIRRSAFSSSASGETIIDYARDISFSSFSSFSSSASGG